MDSRLRHLPISMFSLVLGLAGYAVATQRVFGYLGWSPTVTDVLVVAITAFYVVLLAAYGLKVAIYRDAMLAEFRHPVMINFFPTITISLLLLSIGYAELSAPLAYSLWIVGAALNLALTLIILSSWMRTTRFEITHFSPAWFIPVVGNLIVPIIGVQHGPKDISWLFYALAPEDSAAGA